MGICTFFPSSMLCRAIVLHFPHAAIYDLQYEVEVSTALCDLFVGICTLIDSACGRYPMYSNTVNVPACIWGKFDLYVQF